MFKHSNHRRANRRPGHSSGRRWHRRMGAVAALPVLLLSVTGILLNHVDRLTPQQHYVQSDWLLDWYAIGAPQAVSGIDVAGVEIRAADGLIRVNEALVLSDQTGLIGALAHRDLLHVFTQDRLHIFTGNGQAVESIKLPHRSIGVTTGQPTDRVRLLPSGVIFNLDSLQEDSAMSLTDETDHTAQLGAYPAAAASFRRSILPRERVLQDVHSGRFFGRAGELVMDVSALIFILLAITGIRMWWRQGRNNSNS